MCRSLGSINPANLQNRTSTSVSARDACVHCYLFCDDQCVFIVQPTTPPPPPALSFLAQVFRAPLWPPPNRCIPFSPAFLANPRGWLVSIPSGSLYACQTSAHRARPSVTAAAVVRMFFRHVWEQIKDDNQKISPLLSIPRCPLMLSLLGVSGLSFQAPDIDGRAIAPRHTADDGLGGSLIPEDPRGAYSSTWRQECSAHGPLLSFRKSQFFFLGVKRITHFDDVR